MSGVNRKGKNLLVDAAVEAARKQIVEAGTMRDGTGVARCHAVIAIICAMRDAAPDGSASCGALQDVYSSAINTSFFCSIHDQFARGEIDVDGYRAALTAARENYSSMMARSGAVG